MNKSCRIEISGQLTLVSHIFVFVCNAVLFVGGVGVCVGVVGAVVFKGNRHDRLTTYPPELLVMVATALVMCDAVGYTPIEDGDTVVMLGTKPLSEIIRVNKSTERPTLEQ